MPLNPAIGLAIFLITGAGGVITYTAFHYAEKAGPELTLGDLLPAPPPNPPIPRFLLTKPELIR